MKGTGAGGDEVKHLFDQAQTRWLKPFEVLRILQNHDSNLISPHAPHLPPSGSLFLFNKNSLPSFRCDGHNWRKKKDKNSVFEGHEQLKVNTAKVLSCYYARGEDDPNFRRRSYWMLNKEKKHIVLVHYRDITEGKGKAKPASASGQCYNLCQIDNGSPLENQGSGSLNGSNGSNQSLCSVVNEQQCIDPVQCYNGSAGTSRDVGGDSLWEALGQFGITCDVSRESVPFDAQQHNTDDMENTATELVEGHTLHKDRYFGSDDSMGSNSTVPPLSLEDIDSLLVPQEDPSPTIVSKHKFTIRVISPQWGFADEPTKVIIIGSFHWDPSMIAYACNFGDTQVPMEIIQDSVICCEAPPRRSPGKVSFCITGGNQEPCSEVIEFEYRIRPRQEDDRCTEEAKLLVRFAQMLLPNSSLQKEESNSLTEALQTGQGTSSGAIDHVLQELLKDKLIQWLYYATSMRGGGTLRKKEQGIIHIAAALGYHWALTPLRHCGVGVNFRDTNGWAALHWAAKFGREKMVDALIKAGAWAGAPTDSTRQEPLGTTPASIAYANGHKGLAVYLTEKAVIAHLSSLKLKEASCVENVYAASGEDQRSTEANANTARAAALMIRDIFRMQSLRKRQQREASNVDECGLTSDEIHCLCSASKAVLPKTAPSGKPTKHCFKLPRKAVKKWPQKKGNVVRKYYEVVWAARILKVALRWLRRGAGLRGYKPNTQLTVTDEDNEDIRKDFRKQLVDRMMKEVERVESLVHCPEAQTQYRRLRQTSQRAKDKSEELTMEDIVASLADMGLSDDEMLLPV